MQNTGIEEMPGCEMLPASSPCQGWHGNHVKDVLEPKPEASPPKLYNKDPFSQRGLFERVTPVIQGVVIELWKRSEILLCGITASVDAHSYTGVQLIWTILNCMLQYNKRFTNNISVIINSIRIWNCPPTPVLDDIIHCLNPSPISYRIDRPLRTPPTPLILLINFTNR